jgi:tetratricopeptide (TPR) repeat protein
MAKKNQTDEPNLINVDEVYTKTEQFVDKNRTALTIGIGGLAVIILGGLAYQSFVLAPAESGAEESAWRAEAYFEMDSLDLAAFGDGYEAGLEEIMISETGTSAGGRAAYRMGVFHRDAGSFEEAISAFEEVDFSDEVIRVLSTGNIGDCYVELGDYEAAVNHFDKAVSYASSGLAESVLAPMFLYKAAIVNIELGDLDTAENNLNRIVSDYPQSQQFNTAKGLVSSIAKG